MNTPDDHDSDLIDRPRVSVADHQAFRETLAPRPPVDPIDELLEEQRNIKPEDSDP
jgi:hypothetical protein